MEKKIIYRNENGYIVRNYNGEKVKYMLFDSNGNYIKTIDSIYNTAEMKELFPNL